MEVVEKDGGRLHPFLLPHILGFKSKPLNPQLLAGGKEQVLGFPLSPGSPPPDGRDFQPVGGMEGCRAEIPIPTAGHATGRVTKVF